MNKQSNSFFSLSSNVSKVAAPIGGFLGTLADIFSPLAPFAPIIFVVSLVLFFYFFFLKVRPALKTDSSEIVYSGKPAQMAGFSLITSVIMLLFWGISAQYPEEGVIAGNFDTVKQFQSKILGTLEDISETQNEILESQQKMSDDVKDIKEIVTGEADIKQLASTKDYSTFEEVNARTNISNRKTIAILYFDNSSNNSDLDPLRKGLADMLISDLSNLKLLRVVEREKLEDVMKEIKLSNMQSFDSQTQQKIGKLLGAETILFGSYFELMGQFRIDAKIVKTETGEILKSEGVNGLTTDFMKLEKQLVWKLVRGLDIRFEEKEKAAIMDGESVTYESSMIFAQGLELYDLGDHDSALKKFQKALILSPSFTRAQQMIHKLKNS